MIIQVQEYELYDKIQMKNIAQSSNRHIIWPASITISAITAFYVDEIGTRSMNINRNLPFILIRGRCAEKGREVLTYT